MISPERRTGALGALLLVAAYGAVAAAFGPERVVNFDPVGLAAFALPAFVVGSAVAAVNRWYLPPERLTRDGHRRTVTVMLLGPTAVVALGVALLTIAIGAATSAMQEFEAMIDGASGATAPMVAFTAFVFIAMLIVAIVVLILLIALLVVLGVVLQLGALLGYAATTLALDRLTADRAPGGPTGEPPD